MLAFIQILPEAAVIVAIIGAILFTVLAFRNPMRPKWLRGDAIAVAASLAIAAMVCFGIGNMISGGIEAGFDVGTALVLTIVVCIVAGYAMVRGFRIGERLRRSDAGESPFYSVAGTDTLKRTWQRRFRGGAGA
jgi:hypothetical protein